MSLKDGADVVSRIAVSVQKMPLDLLLATAYSRPLPDSDDLLPLLSCPFRMDGQIYLKIHFRIYSEIAEFS